ncbi:MAG: ABC transporter permease, partial [Rhodobacteraceae bacterium]|nr:ABC transporter permease [Paracoccaceae bacterium]
MSDTTAGTGPVLAADGTPLKKSLARALRVQKMRALMLIAPLLLFVMITFVIPIADMLFRSVENQIVEETLPRTVIALESWDETTGEAPSEEVYSAFAQDMKEAVAAKTHTRVGQRLNYEQTGIASLFRKSGRRISGWDLATDGPFKEQFAKV